MVETKRDALHTAHILLTIPEEWMKKLEMLEQRIGLSKQELIRQWLAEKLVEK